MIDHTSPQELFDRGPAEAAEDKTGRKSLQDGCDSFHEVP
jgi:hypothetical protein